MMRCVVFAWATLAMSGAVWADGSESSSPLELAPLQADASAIDTLDGGSASATGTLVVKEDAADDEKTKESDEAKSDSSDDKEEGEKSESGKDDEKADEKSEKDKDDEKAEDKKE